MSEKTCWNKSQQLQEPLGTSNIKLAPIKPNIIGEYFHHYDATIAHLSCTKPVIMESPLREYLNLSSGTNQLPRTQSPMLRNERGPESDGFNGPSIASPVTILRFFHLAVSPQVKNPVTSGVPFGNNFRAWIGSQVQFSEEQTQQYGTLKQLFPIS